jgi:hypothetical protein
VGWKVLARFILWPGPLVSTRDRKIFSRFSGLMVCGPTDAPRAADALVVEEIFWLATFVAVSREAPRQMAWGKVLGKTSVRAFSPPLIIAKIDNSDPTGPCGR